MQKWKIQWNSPSSQMLGQNFVWAIEATDNSKQYPKIYVCEAEKQGTVIHVGGRKFSSSGRAGAIEIKWNRRRSCLVSGNFGLSFYLVLSSGRMFRRFSYFARTGSGVVAQTNRPNCENWCSGGCWDESNKAQTFELVITLRRVSCSGKYRAMPRAGHYTDSRWRARWI